MKLGAVAADRPGAADRLLLDLASHLAASGRRIAGAVQEREIHAANGRASMHLRLWPDGAMLPISQDLGPGAAGCQLDPDGLERAVSTVAAALSQPLDLLVVNRFGKQEAEGRGFCPLIGEALSADIPVLIGVAPGYAERFEEFHGGLATPLPSDPDEILAWLGF